MKIEYTTKLRLSKENEQRLYLINEIIDEYAADDYRLSLRQLYYQLVKENIVPNTEKDYKKLGTLLVKGRMAGIVDWDAIVDRTRKPSIPYHAGDVPDALSDILSAYRLDRQSGQMKYIEVWVEKDALSEVLKRVTEKYHIHLMVNKGYTSCTAMHDAYKRFMAAEDDVRKAVILYLGDHDPSGLDMIRDIASRLRDFGLKDYEVEHIALTTDQIKEYAPPPNPAKTKDPRASWYIDVFGDTSWEVDALNPKILHTLLIEAIESHMHMPTYRKVMKQEKKDRMRLEDFVKTIEEEDEERFV